MASLLAKWEHLASIVDIFSKMRGNTEAIYGWI